MKIHCKFDELIDPKKLKTYEEKWIEVYNFPDYEISSLGRVKNKKTNKALKPGTNGKYDIVHLWKDKKLGGVKYIHRLILESFVGPVSKDFQAAHLDGIRSNNILDNLKWCTAKENNSHKNIHGTSPRGERHPFFKISKYDFLEIQRLYFSGSTTKDIGVIFKITNFYVCGLLSGKRGYAKTEDIAKYKSEVIRRKKNQVKENRWGK